MGTTGSYYVFIPIYANVLKRIVKNCIVLFDVAKITPLNFEALTIFVLLIAKKRGRRSLLRHWFEVAGIKNRNHGLER